MVVCRRVMGPEGRHDQEIRLQRNAFHYLHRCPVHSSQQLEVDIGQVLQDNESHGFMLSTSKIEDKVHNLWITKEK